MRGLPRMRLSPARPRVGQAPHLRRRGPDLMRSGGDVSETWPVDVGLAPHARYEACSACCGCGLAPHARYGACSACCGCGLAPHARYGACTACCGCGLAPHAYPVAGLAPHAAFPGKAPCGASPTPTGPWPRPDTARRRRSRNLTSGWGPRSACAIRGLLRVLWMRACTTRLPCRCGACPACGVPRQGPVWGKPHTYGAVAPT